jgi:hypothetical protein
MLQSEITLTLTQSASANTEIMAQRQRCEKFMTSARLPMKLRAEIRRYFERTAQNGRGVEKQVVESLPADLKYKVHMECQVPILNTQL